MNLTQLTASEMRHLLDAKEVSSVELTSAFLAQIKKHNDNLNCYITVCSDHALAQAAAADKRLAQGEGEALTGIPYAHKDIFCTKDILTTAGSKMLSQFTAPYDACVSEKLNAAGAVLLGKTNMDEFAMGSSNENSFFGPCKNPWQTEHVAGGSSGGSAAALAAGLAPLATGTDTGGSIRQPAAFCGVTGIKPTYGRVSRYGMIAFASSLDQGGVFARSAEDAAMMLTTMCGHDPRDSTSSPEPVPNFIEAMAAEPESFTVGLPKEYFSDDLDPVISERIESAKQQLAELGAKFVIIDLPHTAYCIPTYYVIAPAEASSNLSRYDGVRFGHRAEASESLKDLYQRSRSEGFGAEVKRRILVGTFALSAGYYDAYYHQAQKVRGLIKADFVQAFKQVDLILAPCTPSSAFKLGEKSDDPVQMYLSDIFTIGASLAGLPAMSLPIGFDNKQLPVGMQLIGNYYGEASLLALAQRFQSESDWHKKLAPLA